MKGGGWRVSAAATVHVEVALAVAEVEVGLKPVPTTRRRALAEVDVGHAVLRPDHHVHPVLPPRALVPRPDRPHLRKD